MNSHCRIGKVKPKLISDLGTAWGGVQFAFSVRRVDPYTEEIVYQGFPHFRRRRDPSFHPLADRCPWDDWRQVYWTIMNGWAA